ncbi:MAG: hypothetical protein ACLRMX_04640 [Lachnospira eligens]
MYQYINSTMGDYVAAGPLKLTKKDSVWNCFARKSGALTQGGTCANEIKAGETYNLKIESNTDGYACTFGNEETITGGFDFKLTSVDSEYVYVGMYVARSADVTFSDVKLVVDGKEITSAGEPENPTPGEPENPTPGEPENPTPGEPENPAPVNQRIQHQQSQHQSSLLNQRHRQSSQLQIQWYQTIMVLRQVIHTIWYGILLQ